MCVSAHVQRYLASDENPVRCLAICVSNGNWAKINDDRAETYKYCGRLTKIIHFSSFT